MCSALPTSTIFEAIYNAYECATAPIPMSVYSHFASYCMSYNYITLLYFLTALLTLDFEIDTEFYISVSTPLTRSRLRVVLHVLWVGAANHRNRTFGITLHKLYFLRHR